MHEGDPLPYGIVPAGFQPHPHATLYVCRSFYRGSLHPGKLYAGHCNIGWGGQEIARGEYEVLKSHRPLRWVSHKYGMPSGAIRGGEAEGYPLFVCRAKYNGGVHPGKLYKGACNIGWGGEEIVVPRYEVLTQD